MTHLSPFGVKADGRSDSLFQIGSRPSVCAELMEQNWPDHSLSIRQGLLSLNISSRLFFCSELIRRLGLNAMPLPGWSRVDILTWSSLACCSWYNQFFFAHLILRLLQLSKIVTSLFLTMWKTVSMFGPGSSGEIYGLAWHDSHWLRVTLESSPQSCLHTHTHKTLH